MIRESGGAPYVRGPGATGRKEPPPLCAPHYMALGALGQTIAELTELFGRGGTNLPPKSRRSAGARAAVSLGLSYDLSKKMSRKTKRMLQALEKHYETNGILPTDFRCPSKAKSSAGSPDFVEAKMTYVGPDYGKDRMPRLAFVSLDPGEGWPDPGDRMAEAVRRRTLADDLDSLPKNCHWSHTHQMAHLLLSQFRPKLDPDDARRYFAHVNTVKCRYTQAHRKQAPATLFRECRRFVPGELRLLCPKIVVTQGREAKNAVLEGFGGVQGLQQYEKRWEPASEYSNDGLYESGIIECDLWRAIWLHTYHPRAYGWFNPQMKACWSLYAEEAHRFCTGKH